MKKIITLLLSFVFLLSSCASKGPATLTVMTHSSFAVSEEIVKSFETANNVTVNFVQSGDAGETLNKAILTKDAPIADVLFGVDNTFLSRALEAGIFESYASPSLSDVPAEFKLDSSNQTTPIDFGDVCINYDKSYFAEKGLLVPQSLEDLSKPEYKDLLVMENPATSSTGLAFLLATRAHFGEDYVDYWKGLRQNGLVVVDGWETAYYTNFSGSSGRGAQPMVVSYGSSPAAEVVFAETPLDDAPTASIIGPDSCFRQIEFAGILKGTPNRDLAEKFIDFMLSTDFQNDMPLQMFVYPVNQNATLPEAFVKYSQAPSQPAVLSPEDISANRDAWIEAWTEAMK
ncbi:MAG: thiamine ABC transporter substrate-binding protein [Anaerolineales bacterium]|nr:thiamine ABC transporter substrate-binding protein [Anaerolineales bacterium]